MSAKGILQRDTISGMSFAQPSHIPATPSLPPWTMHDIPWTGDNTHRWWLCCRLFDTNYQGCCLTVKLKMYADGERRGAVDSHVGEHVQYRSQPSR